MGVSEEGPLSVDLTIRLDKITLVLVITEIHNGAENGIKSF